MLCNYDKLRGRIREYSKTYEDFAKRLHISRSSLSQKLNGKVDFTHTEIINSADILEIKTDEIGVYFFTKKI